MLRNLYSVTVAPTSTALVTLARAKDELGITGESLNFWLYQKILDVSASIDRYLARTVSRHTLAQTVRTDQCLSGLQLRAPIISITSIAEDDAAALASTEYEYDAAAGIAYRLSGGYPTDWQAAKIVATYQAGWRLPEHTDSTGDLVPREIQQGALEWLRSLYASKGTAGEVSAEEVPGLGRVEYQVNPPELLDQVPKVAQRYLDPFIELRL